MSIKSKIKDLAFQNNILMERLDSHSEVRNFIERFKEKYISTNLIRIGGEGEGGYLLPDCLHDFKYCFSPGVDVVANFEDEISKNYGIKSFMADASVSSPPIENDNFKFIPKYLGSRTNGQFITLSDWMDQSIMNESGQKILQMDIEGGEYDVLSYESAEKISEFAILNIEFHGLQNIFERNFLKLLTSIFEKIYKNFSICHVHPNNCLPIVELDGIEIPPVIEVTFIRNDIIEKVKNSENIRLPHKLDRKNVQENEDIKMPKIWWDKLSNI